MNVHDILGVKGNDVATIAPDATIATAAYRLASRGIGALVVSSDGARVDGILSERDIVRGLLHHGAALLERRVRDLMTKSVSVCSPDDSIQHVMATMTRGRHRHMPVVDHGRLCGIVSIGDVVKHRLDAMELETTMLREAWHAHR